MAVKTETLPSSYYPAFADVYVIPPKGGSVPDPEPTPEPEPEPTPPPSSSEQPPSSSEAPPVSSDTQTSSSEANNSEGNSSYSSINLPKRAQFLYCTLFLVKDIDFST